MDKIYRTKDALKKIGVSRATLYNWFRDKKVRDVARDRNNFRIFTDQDIQRILVYKNTIKHSF
ncbi:MAG: MerR family transcriptional regulator [Candidatus Omnitrophica bacterium]|nr:MerR family transcriptional regulator [Candidatus Omnitrophota bacterium]MDD5429287.1 MerR family transcriptional regulator [Candidatus Omnitrophota bacterium]